MSSNRSTAPELDRRIVAEIPRVRAFLARLAGGEAEDLLQDAMARALRSREAVRADGSLRGWLLRIAFRVYLDHREWRRRIPETLGERALEIQEPDGPHPDREADREVVERLLGGLTKTEREVLVRFHRDRALIRDIARTLGMPEGTVKSHLHRGRRRLAGRAGGIEP